MADAEKIVDYLQIFINTKLLMSLTRSMRLVNELNEFLIRIWIYTRQNFVLTAFAMDLAEYFPNLVDPNSRVLVGSNAKKCFTPNFP